MRKFILAGLLVLIAGFTMGPQINTSGRCSSGQDCDIGDGKPSGITLNTDGGDFNVDGTTGNTATMTATTTATAVFQGADAAGAADTTFDTTGAGAIVVGSADVTGVTLTTDGASLNIEGTNANTLTLTAPTTSTMTILGADAAGPSNLTVDTSGAGAIVVGSADVTSVTVTTDGGSVTLDGSVVGIYPTAIELTAGTLTVNSVHIATAAGDYDLPDSCDTATGNWVTLIAQDASELVSLTVLAAEDEIKVGNIDAAANEEIDSPSAATSDGASITVACLQANVWYAVAQVGVWVDGGAAD